MAAGTEWGESQDSSVCELLANVILEAWRTADSVASVYATARGEELSFPATPPAIPSESDLPNGPEIDRMRDLGAAMRINQWEQAGLKPYLPPEMFSSAEAIRQVGEPQNSDALEPGELADEQLSVWLTHFIWEARETLGADVVNVADQDDIEAFADQLAEFLWKHRHTQLNE
ncbi:MAG: hypothetical protein IH991_11410 [Planctomycetes bacterium]|nr:hypothetical protein [Planctomycetota bacterium]